MGETGWSELSSVRTQSALRCVGHLFQYPTVLKQVEGMHAEYSFNSHALRNTFLSSHKNHVQLAGSICFVNSFNQPRKRYAPLIVAVVGGGLRIPAGSMQLCHLVFFWAAVCT